MLKWGVFFSSLLSALHAYERLKQDFGNIGPTYKIYIEQFKNNQVTPIIISPIAILP